MSGIPLHTNAPINARSAPASVPAQTTATSTNPASTSTYPAAQPAGAVSAPTSNAAQRYAPTPSIAPTRTIKEDSDGPPAPQPGAFPTPTTGLTGRISSVPPPPKAGEHFHQAERTASSMPQTYPPQMNIPAPNTTQPPFSSTSTDPAHTHPSTYPLPVSLASPPEHDNTRQSLEHPPGYQQNAFASELTPDQRQAQYVNDSNTGITGGILGGGSGGIGTDSEEGFWNNAKKLVETAGEKLSAGEKEVWRRINKE